MGRFRDAFNALKVTKVSEKDVFQMITMSNDSFFVYNGKVYESDIVRSCIRPYYKNLGKTVAKHIRKSLSDDGAEIIQVNPEPYMKILLEEPNPYMTFQKMIEKLAISLKLNNNAFAALIRDGNGIVREIYPMPATGAEAIWLKDDSLAIRFYLPNGKMPVFRYTDLIHLRGDFYQHDIFGDPIAPALIPLMECVSTIDKGLISAIKNSAVIKWILKISGGVKDSALKKYAQDFAANYLDIENSANVGVAVTDSKGELTQVDPKDYVPNAATIDRTTQRVYKIFNTNEDIIMSKNTEDDWNAYFEAEVEPDIQQLAEEFSRKLFSRRERAFGNYIVFEAYNLTHASFATKLNLVQMVDRGALTPNEWRAVLNLAPIEGGDAAIRRLDTAVVNQIKNLTNRIQGKDPEEDKAIIATINRLIDGR